MSAKKLICCYFQSGNKKEAERLVKNIIKIVIKIGVLHRNNQFNAEETKAAERFRQKFQVSVPGFLQLFLIFQSVKPYKCLFFLTLKIAILITDHSNGYHIILRS